MRLFRPNLIDLCWLCSAPDGITFTFRSTMSGKHSFKAIKYIQIQLVFKWLSISIHYQLFPNNSLFWLFINKLQEQLPSAVIQFRIYKKEPPHMFPWFGRIKYLSPFLNFFNTSPSKPQQHPSTGWHKCHVEGRIRLDLITICVRPTLSLALAIQYYSLWSSLMKIARANPI